jgi:glycosyltransferase involved in cell wall biosynthesis
VIDNELFYKEEILFIMRDNPLISIVLSSYNGKIYLAQSIQSCIDQEYQNWELILIDDCSVIEDTYKIMKSFADKDKRIRIIRNKTNLKLPRSLNLGFANAKGEYFTWTSDDNYYFTDALKELLSALLEKDADAIYSGYYYDDCRRKRLIDYYPETPENFLYDCVSGASFLYKRKVQETLHGYDVNFVLIEDYDFWIRMYLAGFKIVTLDKLLYFYRGHTGALTYKNIDIMSRKAYSRVLLNISEFDKFPKEYHQKFWLYLIKNMKEYSVKSELRKFVIKNFVKILRSGMAKKFLRYFVKTMFYNQSKVGAIKWQ